MSLTTSCTVFPSCARGTAVCTCSVVEDRAVPRSHVETLSDIHRHKHKHSHTHTCLHTDHGACKTQCVNKFVPHMLHQFGHLPCTRTCKHTHTFASSQRQPKSLRFTLDLFTHTHTHTRILATAFPKTLTQVRPVHACISPGDNSKKPCKPKPLRRTPAILTHLT